MERSFLYSHFGIPRGIEEFLDKTRKDCGKDVSLAVYGITSANLEKCLSTRYHLNISLSSEKHSYASTIGFLPLPLVISDEVKCSLKDSTEKLTDLLADYIEQKEFNISRKTTECDLEEWILPKRNKKRFSDSDRKLVESLVENKGLSPLLMFFDENMAREAKSND
jgi:hypothetical protein